MFKKPTSNTADMIAQAKQSTLMAKARLLKTFEFVPDDKLDWTPAEPARTSLQIVAHCGTANKAFATVLRGEDLPITGTPEEAAALIREGGKDIKTREEAVQLVEDSTAEIMEALDGVTAQMTSTSPNSPFGPIPFPFWMILPADHMGGHASQLNYIQTIWGDLQDHN